METFYAVLTIVAAGLLEGGLFSTAIKLKAQKGSGKRWLRVLVYVLIAAVPVFLLWLQLQFGIFSFEG